jgi:hypothetical protein
MMMKRLNDESDDEMKQMNDDPEARHTTERSVVRVTKDSTQNKVRTAWMRTPPLDEKNTPVDPAAIYRQGGHIL